jgi:hypothetical protein
VATRDAAAAQATRHFRAAERDLIGRNIVAPEEDEVAGETAPPAPSKLFAAAGKVATVPFSRSAIMPLATAALAPLLAASATQLPVRELWSVARRLLVL